MSKPKRKAPASGGRSLKARAVVLGLLLGSVWALEVADHWFLKKAFDIHGIRPREPAGLWGILCAPFLHVSYEHLIANTVPLIVLSWFVLLRGVAQFLEVTLIVMLIGGVGTWLIAAEGSVHIGSSILIFGYFGYLMLLGFFECSLGAILVAALVGGLYGGFLWGVLPSQPDVSWEGHLSGFAGGAAAAWVCVRFGKKGKA